MEMINMNEMIYNQFYNGKDTQFNLSMETKIKHSVYILCKDDKLLYKRNDVIDVIMASNFENAIRTAIDTPFFATYGFINVISGDGQVTRVTIKKQ